MIPAHKPASAALQAGEQLMRLSAIKASYAGHKESAEVVHCDLDRAFALGYELGIERAAAIVDQCNKEGPYNAIGAAKRIRALVVAEVKQVCTIDKDFL
jgi:hypothetical protein